MRIIFCALVGVLATWACGAGSVRADTVYADWINVDPRLDVKIVVDYEGFTFSGAVQTGVNNWQVKGGADAYKTTSDYFKANPVFDAFCIEVRQHLADPTLFQVTPLDHAPDPDYPDGGILGMGSVKGDRIRELWGEFFDDIHVGTPEQQRINGAAFQLAVWNIVYDTDSSTHAGTFKATSTGTGHEAARVQANTWLKYIDENDGRMASLVALTNVNKQDMVVEMLPTPAAAGLGIVCFAGLLTRRSRPIVA